MQLRSPEPEPTQLLECFGLRMGYSWAMHAVVRAALIAAALAALSSAAQRSARARTATIRLIQPHQATDELSSVCPAGTLPDSDQCVPVPQEGDLESGADLTSSVNAHRERSGQWTVYEQIPRLPERAPDYEAYRWPVPAPSGGHYSIGGYDLDRPDSQQRRGAHLTFVGHGGVDIMQSRGVEVHSVALEHQQGDAKVVYAGKLFGISVVTQHTVREGGRLRDYVVLHGHLDAIAQGLSVGAPVHEGDLLGYGGDTGSEGLVHLHFEVRQLRDGVEEDKVRSPLLVRPAVSIPCDPRNVLPLK
jgi:murein DD-endopeptidase MepM/ murein hydrolase activator NlpD